ncbi:MAG: S1C family serine protease [Huintestinicola sp.]
MENDEMQRQDMDTPKQEDVQSENVQPVQPEAVQTAPAENKAEPQDLFGEKKFGMDARNMGQPVPPYQNPGGQYYGAAPQNFPPPNSGDMQYRQLYSSNNNANGYGGYQNQPYGYGSPVQGQPMQQGQQVYGQPVYGQQMNQGQAMQGQPVYGQPMQSRSAEIPAMPAADGSDIPQKKASKGWIIALIISAVLMLSAVMIMIAVLNKNADLKNELGGTSAASDSVGEKVSQSGTKVEVNINVAPKPLEDDSYYVNKETGLLTVTGAVKMAMPSVVCVYGYTESTISYAAEASGIIISEDGYIITNAHVVENMNILKVKLSDEREAVAKLIGADYSTDLAVLKIELDGLTPAVIGDAADMEQGEQVIAIGNSKGYNNSVSVGCISYPEREIQSYTGKTIKCFQTDAALNSGVSGGALVNMYGQVIGVLTSKNTEVDSENLGFAIRTDFAVPIVEDLISKGYVTGRPRIGIMYIFVTPEQAAALEVRPGLLVSEVSDDCDVANTGLQKDDIITHLEGVQILTSDVLVDFQQNYQPGDKVTAHVYRKSVTGEETEFDIEFTLDEMK